MKNYLVTGANRGLGLEFVKQLSPSARVFATARNVRAATELKELQRESGGNITIVPMDVSIIVPKKWVLGPELLQGKCLTGVLSNPRTASLVSLSTDVPALMTAAQRDFDVNCLGIARVANAFFPLLARRNAKGRFDSNTGGSFIGPAYKCSKAAANMMTRLIALDPANEHVTVLAMCPGWVNTDMGSDYGRVHPPLEAPESIALVLAFLSKVNREHNGKFFNQHGQEIPF